MFARKMNRYFSLSASFVPQIMSILFPGLYIVLFDTVVWKGNRLPDIISLLIGHKVHCVFQNYFHNRGISGQTGKKKNPKSCWTQLIIYDSIWVITPGRRWCFARQKFATAEQVLIWPVLLRLPVWFIQLIGKCLIAVQEATGVTVSQETKTVRQLEQLHW